MTKGTREKWATRIREWRDSGLSAEEFTSGKDYAASRLRVAASQLEAQKTQKVPAESVGSSTTSAASEAPSRSASKAPRFVALRTSGTSSGSEVVVEVGGAHVRVSRGMALRLLGEVVRALQGVGR